MVDATKISSEGSADIPALKDGYVFEYSDHGSERVCIEEVIGSGGFGITYKCRLQQSNSSMGYELPAFAIKEHFVRSMCGRAEDGTTVVVYPHMEQLYRKSLRDFISEARRLMKLPAHPNIVKVYAVFEANNTAYYVMNYIPGQSLQNLVNTHGSMNESETLAYMLPIIDAVSMIHQQRITHLDIKPGNIMINSDNHRPVLIDFGLSKHYDENGQATSTINTQGYSDGYAPMEQYGGITRFSPASDVYALAATICFCLTGHPLPKASELRNHNLASLLPSNISSRLLTILSGALTFTVDNRIPDATALYSLLTQTASTYVNDTVINNLKKDDETTQLIDAGTSTTTPTKEKSKKSHFFRNSFIVVVIAVISMFIAMPYIGKTPPETDTPPVVPPTDSVSETISKPDTSVEINKTTSTTADTAIAVIPQSNPESHPEKIKPKSTTPVKKTPTGKPKQPSASNRTKKDADKTSPSGKKRENQPNTPTQPKSETTGQTKSQGYQSSGKLVIQPDR